jgi:hypothetical protein
MCGSRECTNRWTHTQYANTSVSLGGPAAVTEAYLCSVHKANRAVGGAAAESSQLRVVYEQEAAQRRRLWRRTRDEKRGCTKDGEAARPQRVRCAGMDRPGRT